MREKIFLIPLIGVLLLVMAGAASPDALSQFEQARTYQGQGELEQAEAAYKKFLTDYPGTQYAFRAQRNLVIVYISRGRYDEAWAGIDELTADFASDPNLPAGLNRIARTYKKARKYDEANILYRRIATNYPDSDYAERARLNAPKTNIFSLIKSGDTDAAQAEIEKLIVDFSDYSRLPAALRYIARIYKKEAKEYELAKDLYQTVAADFPDSNDAVTAQLNVAKMDIISLIESGTEAEVREAIGWLFADFNDSDLPRFLYGIARRCERYGKYEDAISIYQAFRTDYPYTDYALNVPLDMRKIDILSLVDSGEDTAAQAAIDRFIVDFYDRSYVPLALWQVGYRYYERALQFANEGQDVRAKQDFAKVISLGERIRQQRPASTATAEAWYFSAECYDQLGQSEKALEYYQKVVDEWPNYQYAWSAQFRIAKTHKWFIRAGVMPDSDAKAAMGVAFERLVEKFPDCPVAERARTWLDDYGKKSDEGEEK